MSLQGSLKEFGLFEILQLLSLGGKSGILSIEKDSHRLTLTFQDGEIGLCHDSRRPSPYELLQNLGMLGTQETETGKAAETPDLSALTQVLAEGEEPELKKAEKVLHQQVLDCILELVPWDEGDFTFEAATSPDKKLRIAFAVPAIESEAKKCLQEWQEIRDRLPAPGEPLRLSFLAADFNEITVSAEEWRIICSLNNCSTFDELRDEIPLSVFSLGKILVSLFERRIIEKDLDASQKSGARKGRSVEISRHFGGRKIRKQKVDIQELSGKYVLDSKK